ncbi:C40 family peptidase [Saccharopolyspora elongata]|nr:C40 family peptidase [Saccharopolyspora elongata]
MKRSIVVPAVAVALYLLAAPIVAVGLVMGTVLSGGGTGGCTRTGGVGGGQQQLGDRTWSDEQMTNAHTIIATTSARGLPRRAAVIAIATAIVESDLVNVDYGDRDSLGLFQQRPSMGWGTPAEVTTPTYATGAFLDRLVLEDDWDDLGTAAQRVQRSAFPDRYGKREAQATALVDRFWTGPDNPPSGPPPGAQQAGLSPVVTGCPDQGASNVPLDPAQLPPGFTLPPDPRQRTVVSFALAQLGKPYVWGAKGPAAYDCSGLTQASWSAAGVPIPAGTTTQVTAGAAVPSLAAVQPGDLLFIPGSLGSPSNPRHVGVYIGDGLLVNAYDETKGVVLENVRAWAGEIVSIRRPAQPAIPAPPLKGEPRT